MTKSMKNRPGYIPGLNKTNKLYNVPISVIKKHFDEAVNLADFYRRLGYKSSGTSSMMDLYLKRIGLDKNELVLRGDSLTRRWNKPCKEKYNIEDIFIENSPASKTMIKEYVKRHNLIRYACASCGNTGTWQDKPISLQLHHINGISTDQRLTNLQYLCPNCHAQTDTFTSKNYATTNYCVSCGKIIRCKMPGSMCAPCRRLNSGKKIPIRCIETGEVFLSIADANKKFDSAGGNSISKCLKGKRKTAYGFHWEVVNDKNNS